LATPVPVSAQGSRRRLSKLYVFAFVCNTLSNIFVKPAERLILKWIGRLRTEREDLLLV
jgi:hypothetical protein